MDTVFNGIMAGVAVLSMIGSFYAWRKAQGDSRRADESAATAKIYYDMMIEKLQIENCDTERKRKEQEILEFIVLNGDRKTTVAEVIQKFFPAKRKQLIF